MSALATVAALLLWGCWGLVLPALANIYNERGVRALEVDNDVAAAQRDFRRAIALDPDRVVFYQNLAEVYVTIERPEAAINWYEQARERDPNFAPLYYRLSHLYNEAGEFKPAQHVAQAGLERDSQDPAVKLVTEYSLLSNLGRAYFGQAKYPQAQDVLERAIALEEALKILAQTQGGEFHRALPHYFLAQIYEQQGRSEDALKQWRETLRHLEEEDWDQHEWQIVVKEKLDAL